MLQILILAAVAAFLFWRLSIVLGIRTGFEKTVDLKVQTTPKGDSSKKDTTQEKSTHSDDDISDYVELQSDAGKQLKMIKLVEEGFSVQQFVSGAKNAYELILMAYEKGDLSILKQHLTDDVYSDFEAVVADRADKGFIVDANFIGLREIRIRNVVLDKKSNGATITVFFKCELTSVVKDKEENVVEGSTSKIKTHIDVWTFGRLIGSNDPSWKLIATGE